MLSMKIRWVYFDINQPLVNSTRKCRNVLISARSRRCTERWACWSKPRKIKASNPFNFHSASQRDPCRLQLRACNSDTASLANLMAAWECSLSHHCMHERTLANSDDASRSGFIAMALSITSRHRKICSNTVHSAPAFVWSFASSVMLLILSDAAGNDGGIAALVQNIRCQSPW